MAYFADKPSGFVTAFIISDAFLYAALNVVNILFAVYVTARIAHGTVQMATTALVIGFMARILVDIFAGRYITHRQEATKVWIIAFGMVLISASYFSFILANGLIGLSVGWVLSGIGWGIALPTKLSLSAHHINPKQANQEWGLTDAINMALVAVTLVAGTYIVQRYSYEVLFVIAGILNLLGTLPYLIFLKFRTRHLPTTFAMAKELAPEMSHLDRL